MPQAQQRYVGARGLPAGAGVLGTRVSLGTVANVPGGSSVNTNESFCGLFKRWVKHTCENCRIAIVRKLF